ncbi:MAG: hypothetical protein A3D92_10625 [Bacteroidetes bacterium RIFCSPHIGHO2_02_FULL_44_7]|nr:MAG: hypothetical protein A3D92_10625 [Bacteroidetes bacterium RIFCSPHIGHO2_02_FULL_44_7]
MRKLFYSLLATVGCSFLSFGQGIGQQITAEMKDCACDEIIMTSAGYEKRYTGSWIENVEFKDGFIVFSKGSQEHKWNPEKIVVVEKGGTYIHVYLEQAR